MTHRPFRAFAFGAAARDKQPARRTATTSTTSIGTIAKQCADAGDTRRDL